MTLPESVRHFLVVLPRALARCPAGDQPVRSVLGVPAPSPLEVNTYPLQYGCGICEALRGLAIRDAEIQLAALTLAPSNYNENSDLS